jgi:hypothetical protein
MCDVLLPPGVIPIVVKYIYHIISFTCFVWLSDQTVTFALYIINRLVFVTEMESVYCAVWTESLYNTDTSCTLKVKMDLKPGISLKKCQIFVWNIISPELFIHRYCYLNFYQFYDQICVVVQLTEALYYKPEGRRFNSQCCHCNFSLTWSFWPHYGPGVDSASNRMSTGNNSWRVKVTGA